MRPHGSAQKRERGRRHPADAYGCELLDPAEVGLLDRGDGVGAGGVQGEGRVGGARYAVAQGFALLLG